MARALVNVPTSGVIGEIKASMLTLAQFQAQFGTNWVLANGASATGTAYATLTGSTIVPDCRGVSLRGKNNGRSDGAQNPDGDLALGTYQGDMFVSHGHSMSNNVSVQTGGLNDTTTGVRAVDRFGVISAISALANGGNETRTKNVTVNYFIKVN